MLYVYHFEFLVIGLMCAYPEYALADLWGVFLHNKQGVGIIQSCSGQVHTGTSPAVPFLKRSFWEGHGKSLGETRWWGTVLEVYLTLVGHVKYFLFFAKHFWKSKYSVVLFSTPLRLSDIARMLHFEVFQCSFEMSPKNFSNNVSKYSMSQKGSILIWWDVCVSDLAPSFSAVVPKLDWKHDNLFNFFIFQVFTIFSSKFFLELNLTKLFNKMNKMEKKMHQSIQINGILSWFLHLIIINCKSRMEAEELSDRCTLQNI